MRHVLTMIACTATALAWACLPVAARDGDGRGHPHAAPRTEAPAASRFYPQEVEGGVSGNLPFNNQIRKHTDPLNANGSK